MLPNVAGMSHAHFSSDLAIFDGPNRGLTATATSGDRISDTIRPIGVGFELLRPLDLTLQQVFPSVYRKCHVQFCGRRRRPFIRLLCGRGRGFSGISLSLIVGREKV
jgi:hypothetical protein